MTQHKFKVKLLGQARSEVAALKPPFDVVAVFQRKGRVPCKGTINGFPLRTSLMNMGDGHMMVVNAQLRAGAPCRAGDTVAVLMELDKEKRTVEVPTYLKKVIESVCQGEGVLAEARLHSSEGICEGNRRGERPETRDKRIAAMMNALRKGQRRK